MIKKIQKHLLLNSPLLWNMRIIPMLFILLFVHLLFFGIGYLTTKVTFTDSYYYYSPFNELGLLYFFSVLTGILILIGWLIFFSRNNGFRTFYPLKTGQLYLQWLLIFIITSGLGLIPYTMSKGYEVKWKSQASLEEAKQALETIEKVNMLIPEYSYDYYNNNSYYKENDYAYKENSDNPIPIPENMNLNIYDLNLGKYSYYYDQKDKIQITGYIGPSLLFYKSSNYSSYQDRDSRKYLSLEQIKKISHDEKLKNWLKTGEKDSIMNVMKDFYDLHQKHNLETNISLNQWFSIIYNPPFFELKDEPLIEKRETYSNTFYLQYDGLKAAYRHIEDMYGSDNEDMKWFLLVSLCMTTILSFLIFSFRATNRKSWLIALITTGVLFFVIILLSIAFGSIHYKEERIIILFNTIFWITLFGIILSRIIMKINSKSNKGKSNIYMNIFLWLIPTIIPLSFFTVYIYADLIRADINIESEEVFYMFWISIIAMLPVMLPVSALLRKWKGLSEK